MFNMYRSFKYEERTKYKNDEVNSKKKKKPNGLLISRNEKVVMKLTTQQMGLIACQTQLKKELVNWKTELTKLCKMQHKEKKRWKYEKEVKRYREYTRKVQQMSG